MGAPDVKMPPPPPPAPDAADAAVRDAGLAASRRNMLGSRRKSFLFGSSGAAPAAAVPPVPPIATKQLLGT
jgi:hypothetical protein